MGEKRGRNLDVSVRVEIVDHKAHCGKVLWMLWRKVPRNGRFQGIRSTKYLDKFLLYSDMNHVKKTRLFTCEIKRHRQIAPELCAICPRVAKCKAFRVWYRTHNQEYLDFILDIVEKFPEKYQMEVQFMAEKQHFVQIVDIQSGKIDRIVNLKEIDAMSPEEKLELSRHKNLFVVTHRMQPIVKVELKKTVITSPMQFEEAPQEEAAELPEPATKATKGKGRKKG